MKYARLSAKKGLEPFSLSGSSLVSEQRLYLLHMESCVSLSLCHRSTVCLWVVSLSRSLQGSRCSVTCEDGQFFNGHDCQPCHRFCAACAGTVSLLPPPYFIFLLVALVLFGPSHLSCNTQYVPSECRRPRVS